MKKIQNILKIIYFISICLFPVLILLTLLLKINFVITLLYVLWVLLLYVAVHILRSVSNTFVCPNCRNHFKISFIKDIFSYNAKPGAKVLVCPKCNTKEVMSILSE